MIHDLNCAWDRTLSDEKLMLEHVSISGWEVFNRFVSIVQQCWALVQPDKQFFWQQIIVKTIACLFNLFYKNTLIDCSSFMPSYLCYIISNRVWPTVISTQNITSALHSSEPYSYSKGKSPLGRLKITW